MIQHDYADVNGVRLHYAHEGSGELILFVHGFPEFWYAWRGQLAEFGSDHLAVAPDMRGYNLSSKPTELEAYRVPVIVEDIRQLALHLGHERFVLVAHDWGGAVAWAFAMAHPEMLRKIVIINAPHPGTFSRELRSNPDQQNASSYMTFFQSPQAEEVLSANNFAGFATTILGADASEDDKRAYIEAWSQPGALTGGLNWYRASALGPPKSDGGDVNPGFAALDKTIDVPTLVIWGMQDTALLPSNLDKLEDFVSDLTVKRVDGASHWIVREKPDLVNTYIREFL